MSDTWYRDPLPPYEDANGVLWTVDGVCLNPVQGCELPPWMADLESVNFKINLNMELLDAYLRHTERWWK